MAVKIDIFCHILPPAFGARTDEEDLTLYARRLAYRPFDYFKMFCADTAP